MLNLGWLYQNGWGVAQDYDKACKWYQKAADAGNAPAMNNLGWALTEQAKRTEGAGATELLGQAVAAYRSAVKATARQKLPQDWARIQEALAIYRQYWDKPLHGKTFGEITLEDFAAFHKAGLTNPDLSRMKRALHSEGATPWAN